MHFLLKTREIILYLCTVQLVCQKCIALCQMVNRPFNNRFVFALNKDQECIQNKSYREGVWHMQRNTEVWRTDFALDELASLYLETCQATLWYVTVNLGGFWNGLRMYL